MILDRNTKIVIDEGDYEGVKVVAGWVREDLEKVFGKAGEGGQGVSIIAGTVGKSGLIKELLDRGVIDSEGLFKESGEALWEVFKTTRLEEDGKETLVIQGSDKRGTMYGLLSVSEACGVSPFVNWSEATPLHKESVELSADFFGASKEPSVRYRGIFINDEWPAFGNWATKRFGGINAKCYAEIFELLVRLHANYMWPAMWTANFSMDGPGLESAELADRLGIVMSTSHHEPCMRTGEEYRLVRGPESVYGDAWDFISNREGITRFWEDGLKRNAPFENVITMGMRGERDTAIMAKASLADNIALLKDIIRTQNQLIKKYINSDLSKVPRQLVLFTEVEKFYYGDENTPGLIDDPELDGITVIFSDTNYGYTRTLPAKDVRERNGGYGMYYHVDMHGGSYSYEWIGSTYLPRIWDQLGTTYDFGIRNIWVVNVGDLVSQELELSYIMKIAFDNETYGSSSPNNTENFVRQWIGAIFGGYFSEKELSDIFEIISRYSLINERCKHEIMNERVYHPVHFGEGRELYDSCRRIMELCDRLLENAPGEIRTAFYELIYYPAYGTANLGRTWMASTWNWFYADQNRNTANDFCNEIDEGIRADAKLIDDFHKLAGGKFYGHGLSEHFGFRFWNDSCNQLPKRIFIYPAYKDRMLVSKSDEAWYYDGREYTKREDTIDDFLRPDVTQITLEISCGSRNSLSYQVTTDTEWLGLSGGDEKENAKEISGITDKTDFVKVYISREKLSGDDISTGRIVVSDGGECFVTLYVKACNRSFYESVCREADNIEIPGGASLICCGNGMAKAHEALAITSFGENHYEILKPYGRHGSGLKLYPNTADLLNENEKDLPYAEYVFVTADEGEYDAEFIFAPSFPVTDENRQFFSYVLNGSGPIRLNTVLEPSKPMFSSRQWHTDNRRNAKIITCKMKLKKGINTLDYYQLSPNLILEKIVLWDVNRPRKESYLGPESGYRF